MKVFVLFLSLCFVLNVVISSTYASEEECTIKASCRTPSIVTTKWMTFVTPDDTAKIEAEVSLLKKNNAVMERVFDKLEKEAVKSKEKLDDATKQIELLNEEVERMEKEANESKANIDDAMIQVSLLKKTNAVMESEFDKLEKEAEKSKRMLNDSIKKIELLNEEIERMEKEANESKANMDDAIKQIELLKKKNAKMEKDAEESKGKTEDLIKRIVSLENENAEKMSENGGTSEKETSAKTGNEKNTTTVLCPVKHGKKCFFPVKQRLVNYDDGVAICESLGGHLANIYSQTHMDDVMKYIRENRMDGFSRQWFRLGMKYDPKVKKLTFRDGTDAPAGLKWWSGAPLTEEANAADAHRTTVVLSVTDQFSIWQYLVNVFPRFTSYVLCEIE